MRAVEISERIKQARMEAGMSQRQLGQGIVTRNMLSMIENGVASPSMDTLAALAERLGKPVSWFLDEDTLLTPNRQRMEQVRDSLYRGEYAQAARLLEDYQSDGIFDREKGLLESLVFYELAKLALSEGKNGYAAQCQQRALEAFRQGYPVPGFLRELILLAAEGNWEKPGELEGKLPDPDRELLLRAENALEQENWERCEALLISCSGRGERWYFLRGECFLHRKDYPSAKACYQQAAQNRRVYARLEQCCLELEDYKGAWEYAKKQGG